MKVRQIIEAGQVKNFYMSSWTDNQLELTFEGGEIKLSLPEDIMKRLHQRLDETLKKLTEQRLADAKQLVETEDE
tara:strand:- start:44 stop:268 length:225 start_codon:yes stop_codon:yes gene_type:complete